MVTFCAAKVNSKAFNSRLAGAVQNSSVSRAIVASGMSAEALCPELIEPTAGADAAQGFSAPGFPQNMPDCLPRAAMTVAQPASCRARGAPRC